MEEKMEYLDIVDEHGQPTGEIVERSLAHENGILHRTSHVWLFRKHNGHLEVLLQKRSENKDSFPGCYDISSAGHIPAGDEYLVSAIRELKEELGIDATEEEFLLCGTRRIQYERMFYGKWFRDNQVSNVYILFRDIEADQFKIQESELAEVRWMDFMECMDLVKQNKIKHCIMMEELLMLKSKLQQEGIGL